MTDRRVPAILRAHSLNSEALNMDRNFGDKRKRSDATGGRHRRWLSSIALTVVAGLMFVPVLLAVHDFNFELDGNVVVDNVSPTPFDWVSIFDAAGTKVNPLPTGFSAAAFSRDFLTNPNGSFNTNDATTFATGSKDILAISGWQCNFDSNVNSKIDIVNAYAAAYKDPTSGDDVIYFALERNANTGDANVGFWFLQDAVGCNSNGGTGTFTGEHKDGDLLIVSAFTNGGTVSTIDVYRWDRPGNPAGNPGAINTTPVAHGVDCRSATTPAGDPACAAANTAAITVPWLTAAKTTGVGHSLPTAQFFEGGLNLTDSGLAGKCFNVFIGDTRSSQSLTATLFDYAEGTIGECTSTTTTQSSITGSTGITAAARVSVSDTATVTVNGVASFSGKVDFFLCGPSATIITVCADGAGVAAGSPTITASGQVSSSTMVVTSVGYYCWRAVFSGDSSIGVPGSRDNGTNECFQVTPLTAAVDTQAGTTPVDLGQAVSDTATLSGTAKQPGTDGATGSITINASAASQAAAGGTIEFTLLKNDCTTLASGTGTNPQSVTVSGDGSYGPVSFTPDAPGTYHWKAVYSGNAPNTIGNSHNTACDDADETVVVRQIPTEIRSKQNWIPNDTAEIKSTVGNLAAGGTVVFTLYESANCTGTVKYGPETKTLTGGAATEEVSTSNTGSGAGSFKITTEYGDANPASKGPFSWKVVYTPAAADTAHTGKQSSCASAASTESFTINYHNDAGPGTN